MRWRLRVRVSRPTSGGGYQDPDTGAWVSTESDQVLYDDRAMVQDAGESRPRLASGMPQLQSDATVILRNKKRLTLIQPGDKLEVFYPDGRTADGEVQFAREIDGVLLARYL